MINESEIRLDAADKLPRVGSAVVVRDADRILLGMRNKEPNCGKWVIPGGKVEPFESLRSAGQREIEEETGLTIEIEDQIGAFEIIDPPREHRIIVYNWAHPTGGRLRPASDILLLQFCSKQDIAKLDISPVVRQVLEYIGWA